MLTPAAHGKKVLVITRLAHHVRCRLCLIFFFAFGYAGKVNDNRRDAGKASDNRRGFAKVDKWTQRGEHRVMKLMN